MCHGCSWVLISLQPPSSAWSFNLLVRGRETKEREERGWKGMRKRKGWRKAAEPLTVGRLLIGWFLDVARLTALYSVSDRPLPSPLELPDGSCDSYNSTVYNVSKHLGLWRLPSQGMGYLGCVDCERLCASACVFQIGSTPAPAPLGAPHIAAPGLTRRPRGRQDTRGGAARRHGVTAGRGPRVWGCRPMDTGRAGGERTRKGGPMGVSG